MSKSKEEINDKRGYFFEHALCDTIKNEKQFPYSPFFLMPQIEGMSGSNGEIYKKEKISISFAIKYLRYTYAQRRCFNRQYR